MKFVFSPAVISAFEEEALSFLESLAEKHFGTKDAAIVAAVGQTVATVGNAAAGINTSDPSKPDVVGTEKGKETPLGDMIKNGLDVGLGLAAAEAGKLAGSDIEPGAGSEAPPPPPPPAPDDVAIHAS